MKLRVWKDNKFASWAPNIWDIIALLLLFSVFALLAFGALQMGTPYHLGQSLAISLSPRAMPYYALRTVIRIFVALFCSLIFTLTIGTFAAKNKHAEKIIIPLIDILQSVPILGYLSITIVAFIWLFPNSLLGPECAAIFSIFTMQVWNMVLGFYQSLKTLPIELREATAVFCLSGWQKFWRLEVPFAIPSLIWNMMMSLSGGWFFIIAAEAITVNHQQILLPGIGSYIAIAIKHMDKHAIVFAIITMLIVILVYDQLLFRPLIVWSSKFQSDLEQSEEQPSSFVINFLYRTRLLYHFNSLMEFLSDQFINFRASKKGSLFKTLGKTGLKSSKLLVILWYTILIIGCSYVVFILSHFIFRTVPTHEALHVALLGIYTTIRIFILVCICCVFWIPICVWIGLRPRAAQIAQPIAQFLAAFPANLLFPVASVLIIKYSLNVNIWTTPLLILGSQWYLIFNVIAGASALPKDLIHVAKCFSLKRWLWWKRFILPGIFPYLITGAITATGGAWNASIVAEYITWGNKTLAASGLGAYITQVTNAGDFPRIALGISVMCVFVLLYNRLIWQPLYNLAQKRFQLDQ